MDRTPDGTEPPAAGPPSRAPQRPVTVDAEGSAAVSGARLRLRTGGFAAGGGCVARGPDGRVVFVRHSLPGEEVVAVVTDASRRFLRADAVAVLEASPHRVTPRCPHAGPGRCGGCDWQHVSLPAQRRAKASLVAAQLRQVAGLDVDVVVEEVPGWADGYGWRTRMQFAVDPSGRAGLHRHRSHQVEPVDDCLLAAPGIGAAGLLGARWPPAGLIRVATTAAAGGEPTTRQVVVEPRQAARPGHRQPPARLPPHPPAGPPPLTVEVQGRRLQVSAGSFWQVHPGAPQVLASAVTAGLAPQAGDRLVDLYAGVGLFAAVLGPLVAPGGSVTAVESAPCAVADARRNLADLGEATVVAAEVSPALVARQLGRPDLVVLDPPRRGAGTGISAALAGCGARRIAYVACDPAAAARDLRVLLGHGWRLRSLRAFDLFPMTEHVEVVAVVEPGPR